MRRILSVILLFGSLAFGQQPQAPVGTPLYNVNAQYVQGVSPGYWATQGTGLTVNIAAGSVVCGGTIPISYAGGSLTMPASSTNYGQLNSSSSCAPYSNTTGFLSGNSPL